MEAKPFKLAIIASLPLSLTSCYKHDVSLPSSAGSTSEVKQISIGDKLKTLSPNERKKYLISQNQHFGIKGWGDCTSSFWSSYSNCYVLGGTPVIDIENSQCRLVRCEGVELDSNQGMEVCSTQVMFHNTMGSCFSCPTGQSILYSNGQPSGCQAISESGEEKKYFSTQDTKDIPYIQRINNNDCTGNS